VPLEDHFKIKIVPRLEAHAEGEVASGNDTSGYEFRFRLFIAKGETPKDIPDLIKQGCEDANEVRAAANVILAQKLKHNPEKKYPKRTWSAIADRVSTAVSLQPNKFYTPSDFKTIFKLREEDEGTTKGSGSSKEEEIGEAADAEAASNFTDLNESVLIYFNKPVKPEDSEGGDLDKNNTGLHKLLEGDDADSLPDIDNVYKYLSDVQKCAQMRGGKDSLLPLHITARASGKYTLELKYSIIQTLLEAFPEARNLSLPCGKDEKCLPLILAINSGLSDSRIINALWTKEVSSEMFKIYAISAHTYPCIPTTLSSLTCFFPFLLL